MFGFDRRHWGSLLLSFGLLAAAVPVLAQDDEPPGRVGRLADVQGRVWIYDQEQGQWTEALRNRALTSGDRLSTERGARAEVRIGSTELRLDGDTELDFDRIDDERMVLQLANGSLALRVRSREIAQELEVRSGDVRVRPERAGHYRIDREDEVTYVAAWRGALRVDTGDQQVQVAAGRRAEFYRERRDGATAVSWSGPVNDAFSDWVARDERRDQESVARRYVSPEMTGVEDLDRYGRWDRHPEYGMVWFPLQVAVGWAPYRHGRWTWQARWGWTWLDEAPWGFAPFHYGRWVSWGGRWVWSPGTYVARPVFAPALVAWVGGSNASVSISIGGRSGPAVGWLPLSPRDAYVPSYRYNPRYYERVNQPHRPYHPKQVPTGPVMYGNRGVPDAVTVVPADVLSRRQPVAPSVVRDPEVGRAVARERFRPETPEQGRVAPRVVAVPGGAEPVRVPPPGREVRREPSPRVIDLRRERAEPVSPVPMPAQVQTPQRQERQDRPERQERQERPGRQPEAARPVQPAPVVVAPQVAPRVVPQTVPQVVPPVVPQPTAPREARPPRNERDDNGRGDNRNDTRNDSRNDNRGDNRPPDRTPESRQNQRERQNLQ